MKFHHIGICCKNIKEEIENIKKIHQVKSVSKVIYDKKQEAELCILEIEDGLKIELIAGKQVENLLKKKITYYHICYEVENITKEKEKLIKNGAFLLSNEKEAVLFSNRKVCFLMTFYGMIELVEK
ncbi:MAG: VOC family protein [Fusobacterium varium]|uniref:VOC family protein n=1 Tax=Fusobacterium varium TaxID=856 RepID=UPI0039928D1E